MIQEKKDEGERIKYEVDAARCAELLQIKKIYRRAASDPIRIYNPGIGSDFLISSPCQITVLPS